MGCGIAGLVATESLADKGHEVAVIEASDRPGGRLLTHRYKNTHAELGAMRIPAVHNLTRDYCARFGVSLEPFANSDPNNRFRFRNHTTMQNDVDSWLKLYKLPRLWRAVLRNQPNALLYLLFFWMRKDLRKSDIKRIMTGDLANGSRALQALDKISLRDYALETLGHQELAELFGSLHYLTGVWRSSCIAFLKELYGGRLDGLTQPVEGMELLSTRYFEALKPRANVSFEFNSPVTRIDASNQSFVSLCYGDGLEQRFDAVVCTIPFPVLRQLQLRGIAADKMAAIREYAYAASTKTLLNFGERFWEQGEDPIYGGISVLDEMAGQIVYPTTRQAITPRSKLPAQFPSVPSEPLPATYMPMPDQQVAPEGILMSYTWGEDARRMAVLSQEQRIESVLNAVIELHGRDAVTSFDGGVSMAWDRHPWSGGAFGQPLVRDLLTHRDAAMRPEGCLYFAGEHLSGDPGWIQGSIASALYTCRQLLTDLK